MARAQQQGVGVIKVWLSVFAALWLTAMVFLVVLYTGQEELKSHAAGLQAANARLINRDQERNIAQIRNIVDGGETAVGLLEEARGQTALVATGDPADDVNSVRAKRDETLRTIRGENLVGSSGEFADLSLNDAINRLYAEFKREYELRQAAEERLRGLETQVTNLTQANTDLTSNFEQEARDLRSEFSEEERARTAAIDEIREGVAQQQSDFEARRAQADADLTKERQRRASAEEHLEEMRARVRGQQEKFGELLIGPQEFATARQPDGRVLTAIPGDEIVYIDLGREDRLTLGLQFAVYPADEGIPADGRAKAQIEVVSISDSSAECRIVRTQGSQVVLEDDLIANPVYDASRPPTFVVVGLFDLDRDGHPDPASAAAIESMIVAWGGAVGTELTALTDFVVLGAAPLRPRTVADPTGEQAKQAESLQRLRDRYESTVDMAKVLSVPVMTQEVFLNFLGYTSRLATR